VAKVNNMAFNKQPRLASREKHEWQAEFILQTARLNLY